MNNHLNNQLLNQNSQQQYLIPQSFETQVGKPLDVQFDKQVKLQDTKIKVDLVQNMFLINLGMIGLGLNTKMIYWLVTLNSEYYLAPSWLFYISLVISIVLQFTFYFGGNIVRKAPYIYIGVILYLVFFGFTFTTISIFIAIRLQTRAVWVTWGISFLIIFSLTWYIWATKEKFLYQMVQLQFLEQLNFLYLQSQPFGLSLYGKTCYVQQSV